MKTSSYPRIRVSGTAYERGEQYGRQAREQVLHSRNGYEKSFAAKSVSWPQAVAQALDYQPAIEEFFPEVWQELLGIAEGAGLPYEDILAMNCRTEILWRALRESTQRTSRSASPERQGECSSFAIAPTHTASGRTLVGQNWDWLIHGINSVVLLEVEREDGPNYITIVEAGLLGKTMLNEHGLGMAVNTLVTSLDGDAPGVPFHVLLRALADCKHAFDAVELLAATPRAAAGNYVIGSAGGAILNIETGPGGIENLHLQPAKHGKVMHTNHFLQPLHRGHDLAPLAMSDSYVRLGRLRQLIGVEALVITIGQLDAALRDHTDAPGGICCHPDARSEPAAQWSTVMSVVMDLESRTLYLSEGNPCGMPRREISYAGFLGVPQPAAI